MISQDLHTHTSFDDGACTPAQMAQAALEAGLTSIGFSAHSILPYENDWGLTEETAPAYVAAVEQVKKDFAGRLEVYCGLEWDGISTQSRQGFDYVIGSFHHIPPGGDDFSIDYEAGITKRLLVEFFSGDKNAMLQTYYEQYAELAKDPWISIIGHFDVISKYDDLDDDFFDQEDPFYRECAMAALEPLALSGKIFEVNTGGMSRGYRKVPYPAPYFLKELKARRARVLLSSDAHQAEHIAYGFDQMEELLRSIGFQETWRLGPEGFYPVKL